MEREFPLEIITPQQQFWQKPVQALSLTGPLGSMTILASHAPLVAGIHAQRFRLKTADDGWQELCCADGFLEVRPDRVLLFVQDCAWPTELDAHLARTARAQTEEQALRRRSVRESKTSAIQMTRAIVKMNHPELTQQD